MSWHLVCTFITLMCMSLPTTLLKYVGKSNVSFLLIVHSQDQSWHSPTFALVFSFRNLLALHRMATLHRDELGQVNADFLLATALLLCCGILHTWLYVFGSWLQETLLNLLLRNYLHYNLYDQAEKLRSKAPRFEAHSNQQVIHLLIQFVVMQLLDLLCFRFSTCKPCM